MWFLFLIILLSGCEVPPDAEHRYITFKSGLNINEKMSLAIDIVQVYDKNLYYKLREMSVEDFQHQKKTITSNNPDDLSLWSVDVMENDSKSFMLPFDKNYYAVIVFVYFFNNVSSKFIIPENMRKSLIIIQDEKAFLRKDTKMGRKYIKLNAGEIIAN